MNHFDFTVTLPRGQVISPNEGPANLRCLALEAKLDRVSKDYSRVVGTLLNMRNEDEKLFRETYVLVKENMAIMLAMLEAVTDRLLEVAEGAGASKESIETVAHLRKTIESGKIESIEDFDSNRPIRAMLIGCFPYAWANNYKGDPSPSVTIAKILSAN